MALRGCQECRQQCRAVLGAARRARECSARISRGRLATRGFCRKAHGVSQALPDSGFSSDPTCGDRARQRGLVPPRRAVAEAARLPRASVLWFQVWAILDLLYEPVHRTSAFRASAERALLSAGFFTRNAQLLGRALRRWSFDAAERTGEIPLPSAASPKFSRSTQGCCTSRSRSIS